MDKHVIRIFHLAGFLLHRGQLEAAHGSGDDLGFRSGQKTPPRRVSLETLRIGFQHRGRVETGIRRERHELDGQCPGNSLLQFGQPLRHARAGAAAAGENDARQPDFPAELRGAERPAGLVGQRKIGNRKQHRERLARSPLSHAHDDERRHDGGDGEADGTPDDPFNAFRWRLHAREKKAPAGLRLDGCNDGGRRRQCRRKIRTRPVRLRSWPPCP